MHEIWRSYRFEAAHRLPLVAAGHKCRNLHGHSYTVIVRLAGAIDATTGMIVDFAELDRVVGPLISALDHTTLNERIENPTAEALAEWFWSRICDHFVGLSLSVEVQETERAGAVCKSS